MSEVARVSDHSGVRVPRAFFVLNMPGGSLNRQRRARPARPPHPHPQAPSQAPGPRTPGGSHHSCATGASRARASRIVRAFATEMHSYIPRPRAPVATRWPLRLRGLGARCGILFTARRSIFRRDDIKRRCSL